MRRRGLKFVSSLGVSMAMIAISGLVISAAAAEPAQQQGVVDKARITFQSFMTDENMAWLRDNMGQAKGLLIVPELLKGGFVIGGSGGSGVLLVRDEKTGEWSQPVFYTLGSVTFGFQIGGEKSEIIMMVRTQRALETLYTSSFKLGGDTSVSAGPVGVGAKATVLADFLSFGRSKGAFAGISLEGAVIKIRDGWNQAYYGKEVRPVDIIVTQSVSNPGSDALRAAIKKAAQPGH